MFSKLDGDYDSIPLDGIFLAIIGIRFDMERAVYLELSFFLIDGIRVDPQDELLYRELSYFLIGEIYLDLQDNILLGIIIFPLSMGYGLICRTWAFMTTHNRPLDRADWAFIMG